MGFDPSKSTAGYSLGILIHCCCLDLLCKRMGFSPFSYPEASVYADCIPMYTACISALFLYIKLYAKCIQPKSAPEHLYFAFALYYLYFNLYISVY
uniref:Uncharacterized protein n=1 Tax=Solanum tuberosum TaxID=4113 RepID=M1B4T6_SOLTU